MKDNDAALAREFEALFDKIRSLGRVEGERQALDTLAASARSELRAAGARQEAAPTERPVEYIAPDAAKAAEPLLLKVVGPADAPAATYVRPPPEAEPVADVADVGLGRRATFLLALGFLAFLAVVGAVVYHQVVGYFTR